MEREALIQLVTAVQKGDNAAAGELYNQFYNDVYYYYIYKTVNDQELAADLTQDTFIEIFQTIGKLQEPAAFVTWSRQVAYHRYTGHFKKRRELLADENEDGSSVFDTIPEEREEFIPDEALDKQELKSAIRAMIDDLPEEQRSAIMMRYFDEFSVEQIAQIQGVSVGTVKSRLNYGRKAIKGSVENYERKSGVKLRCVGIVPLLLWLFKGTKSAGGAAGAVEAAAGAAVVTTEVAAGVAVAAKAGAGLIAKIVAGIVAAAVAVGGSVALMRDKEPEPTEPSVSQTESQPEELPPLMDWSGYGTILKVYPRTQFQIHIDDMNEETITGHLTVSMLYEVHHDTAFTGTGTATEDGILYSVTFETQSPSVMMTDPVDGIELLYSPETDSFLMDGYYYATLSRETREEAPVLEGNVVWSGVGEDTYYALSDSDHHYRLEITQMREDHITGTLTVSWQDRVDHYTTFEGEGHWENGKLHFGVLLDTSRTYDMIVVYTLDRFWLVYDPETDTFRCDATWYDSVTLEREE